MAELPVKNKDEWRDYMCRSASVRNTDLDVGDGSVHYVLFSAAGDALAIQSFVAKTNAQSASVWEMTEEQVEKAFARKIPRNKESKSTGYVVLDAAIDGALIYPLDGLVFKDTKQRYVVKIDAPTLFLPGDLIPVESVDPGSATLLAAGKRLEWSQSRAGCYATAIVYTMPDGSGLYGGASVESLESWKGRISDAQARPSIRGNEYDLLGILEDCTGRLLGTGEKTPGHGVPVRKGFIYPALLGPGICGFAFLIRRENWWESQKPTSQQMTTVNIYARSGTKTSGVPADFGMLPITLEDQLVTVFVAVTLNSAASQWSDYVPWPLKPTSTSDAIVVTSAGTATAFTLGKSSGAYDSNDVPPSPGNNLAFFDTSTGKAYRKRILEVSGTGPWAITCDTSAGASDTSFVPQVGAVVSPWCDCIGEILNTVGQYVFDLGPGECIERTDGLRGDRVPEPTHERFDNKIDSRVGAEISRKVRSVASATFIDATPYSKLQMGRGDTAAIFKLKDVGIYSL